LTYHIAALEKEFGVLLVQRSGRGSQVTGYGKTLLAHARTVDREIRHARDELRQLTDEFSGEVSLAISIASAVGLLPEALSEFAKKHPSVHLRIVDGLYPGVFRLLREGSIDFALGPLPPAKLHSEFTFDPLVASTLVIACRRSHPRIKTFRTLADLASEEWVAAGEQGGPGTIVQQIFGDRGIAPPRIVVQAESIISFQSILESCNYLGLLPAVWFKHHPESPLSVVSIRESLPTLRLGIIRVASAQQTPAAKAFIAALRKSARHF